MNKELETEEKVEQEPTDTPQDEPIPDTASKAEDTPPSEEEEGGKKKTASESIKGAWKQVFGQALNVALQGRGNVVMVRINDEALRHLDMMVDAEITKSRSESAAFLINEGIRANQELFDRIGAITQQISELRAQLRDEVQREMQNKQSGDKE